MAAPRAWVLSSATVEVQYLRGVVFLDRAGSLMLELEDALGKPFVGNVPAMTGAELKSMPERINVTFGSESLGITQSWESTVARLELVSYIAWERISAALNVGKHVKRFGVRYQFMFGTDTKLDAERALSRCRVSQQSPQLTELLGDGSVRALSYVIEDTAGRLKLALDCVELTLSGSLPADLANIVPATAVLLDLDHIYPSGTDLPKGQLKEFIRNSWQRSRSIAKLIGEQIGAERVELH